MVINSSGFVNKEFVHLHNHTEYSLLDGACRIVDDRDLPAELLRWISTFSNPALAITDHGNMFGAIEFYRACTSLGIKPIIGCEVYIAPQSRFMKKNLGKVNNTLAKGDSQPEVSFDHLTLLATDITGYKNLMNLVSIGYLEGYYYRPRIDKEILEKYRQGLIVLSGCLKGEIQRLLLQGKNEEAKKQVDYFSQIFGKGNFYLELMDNDMPQQKKLIPLLVELSKTTGIEVVVTNDCHYLKKEDAYAHDILLCIGTGRKLNEPERLRFPTNEFYYKSADEMHRLFSYSPQGLKNTLVIAEKCNLRISFDQLYLPEYILPQGGYLNLDEYLENLCYQGLKERYPSAGSGHPESAEGHSETTPEIDKRLRDELALIKKMGYAGYFLIVWDFVRYAKKEGIPIGPGRGSGAGSLVAYVLGITNIDPLKYGLLFERFLNPERRTLPDLDIDFSDTGREKVITYVKEKYGNKNVAQIITFGSMDARLAVRDVGRVLDLPLSLVDRIAKLIPFGSNIFNALQTVPQLKNEFDENEPVQQMLTIAQKLEGLKRHTGVHAAGIVIAKEEITNFTPLAKQANTEVVTTQYNDDSLLKLGMLKIDFLGLRNLTTIEDTLTVVNRRKKLKLTRETIPLDDKTTFQLLSEAKTVGVFQLSSSGMRDLLRKLKPTIFEDLIALVSLYRPGPMGSGMLDEFVLRKHNPARIKYEHPLLEPILKETYGVIVYQEQVMRIAAVLAGFTPAEADILRQAMGKKIPEEIERQRGHFLEGAKEKHLEKRIANKIFDLLVHFGGYGFNKSHAAAYALLAYKTAFLKANHPIEYMTVLLGSEIGRATLEKSRLMEYVQEAEEMGIEIIPPDIQHSFTNFSIETHNGKEGIRYALSAIKNVGEGATEIIVQEREKAEHLKGGKYKSFEDFLWRLVNTAERALDHTGSGRAGLNRKTLESLIKAGACDCFNQPRAQLFAGLDTLLEKISREQRLAKQGSFFSNFDLTLGQESAAKSQQPISEWPEHLLLNYEKEMLGFYFSGHPLARWSKELKLYSTCSLAQLKNESERFENTNIRCAGIIVNVKRLISKEKKEQYARFKLEDLDDEIDVLVFPKAYANGLAKYLVPNSMIVVSGRVNPREEKIELIAESILPFIEAREKYVRHLWIKLSAAGLEDDFLKKLKNIMEKHPGKCKVGLHLINPAVSQHPPEEKEILIESGFSVSPKEELVAEIEEFLGKEAVEFTT